MKILTNLGRTHCPKGKIWRKGYTTKRNVKVKGTCIIDRGKPGKGPKLLPTPRPGALRGWKKEMSDKQRRGIVNGIANLEGCAVAIRRLNLLRNITADPGTKRKASSDLRWLQKQRICKRRLGLGAEYLIELGRSKL